MDSMAPVDRVLWYSNVEWLEVYNCIFSSAFSQKKVAAEKIAVWELKASCLPEAMRCTRLLLEASLADKHGCGGAQDQGKAVTEVQMLYSIAIIRFVDHYMAEQKKPYVGDTSSDELLAEAVNCRLRIVQCQEVPSLDVLRHIAGVCFNFIAAKYWHPQAEDLRSRLVTIAHSKQLASGLVALLQDLESLLPADSSMEASLTTLLSNLATKRSSGSPPSICQLLQCAAAVTGLKQRDTMRALRRFKLAEVLSEPVFVDTTAWCQALRDGLPRCLNFIESIFHSCPHENVTLSFLKDFILLLYDPELSSSAPIVLAVFWILSRAPPRLMNRLISRLIRAVVGLPCEKDPSVENSETGSSFPTSEAACGVDHTARCPDAPSSPVHHQTTGCFDYESFSLWLRTTDVPLEEEKQLKLHLCCNFGYQSRLLSWLRCLLLLPVIRPEDTSSNETFLPDGVDFLLHLFCDPQIDAMVQLSSSASYSSRHAAMANIPSPTLKDAFCQRLLSAFYVTHSRVVSSCRGMLDVLAQAAYQCLLMRQKVGLERGLRGVLRLFKDAEVVASVSGSGGQLLEWLNRRIDSVTAPGMASKRQVIQRLFPTPDRRSVADSQTKGHGVSLLDEFSSLLLSFQSKVQYQAVSTPQQWGSHQSLGGGSVVPPLSNRNHSVTQTPTPDNDSGSTQQQRQRIALATPEQCCDIPSWGASQFPSAASSQGRNTKPPPSAEDSTLAISPKHEQRIQRESSIGMSGNHSQKEANNDGIPNTMLSMNDILGLARGSSASAGGGDSLKPTTTGKLLEYAGVQPANARYKRSYPMEFMVGDSSVGLSKRLRDVCCVTSDLPSPGPQPFFEAEASIVTEEEKAHHEQLSSSVFPQGTEDPLSEGGSYFFHPFSKASGLEASERRDSALSYTVHRPTFPLAYCPPFQNQQPIHSVGGNSGSLTECTNSMYD